MAVCKSCGESIPECSRFCGKCGTPVANEGSAAADAMGKAKKEFERDSLASLDRSRITYVCSLCGTVNNIDQDKCVKCGKPRPRNEFVSALKKIKNKGRPEPAPVAAPVVPKEEPAPVVQEAVEQPQQTQVTQTVTLGGQQAAVVQPFIVVPYVNPLQPIWQYTEQVYRFQPYTEAELLEMRRLQAAEQAEAEAVAAAQKPAEQAAPAALPEAGGKVIYSSKMKAIRITSLFQMLLAAAVIVFTFIGALGASGKRSAFDYIAGLVDFVGVKLFGGATGWSSAVAVDGTILGYVVPALFALGLIFSAILFFTAFARLVTGLAKTKGFVFPLIIFAAVAAALVLSLGTDNIVVAEFPSKFGFGAWALLGASAALFIVGCFRPKNIKIVRKTPKAEPAEAEKN